VTDGQGTVVVIGGTRGIGKEVARPYADAGRAVYLSGRDAGRAKEVADEIGGQTTGFALDLAQPHDIAGRLDVIQGPVDYLVVAGMERDRNVIHEYDVDRAIGLVTQKLVGYAKIVHALLPKRHDGSSIVLFGGLAKDRPYPGSTTVTTVNGGVSALIRTLAVQLGPIRVNALHPGVVGDSPYWKDSPPEFMENLRERTPIGRTVSMEDMVHGTVFLLENGAANGVNLELDGGWLLQ
jgi:NAD(P)-dependent dehydrogenase (short-subunit alcohol dehydrogenase family)